MSKLNKKALFYTIKCFEKILYEENFAKGGLSEIYAKERENSR